MGNLRSSIIGIVLGVRFVRSFRIPDIGGDIVDHILYEKGTPFGIDFFPRVNQKASNNERVLFNPGTDEYLRINTDDIILGINVDNNFEEKYNWVRNDILSFLKKDIFQKFKIKNIKRVGIVYSHKISQKEKLHKIVERLTEKKVIYAENINISFSKKLSIAEAMIRKTVNDYENTIYNIQEFEGGVAADLDFQHYFEPMIEDFRDCPAEEVLDSSKNFLDKDFHPWLSAYETEETK